MSDPLVILSVACVIGALLLPILLWQVIEQRRQLVELQKELAELDNIVVAINKRLGVPESRL